MTRRNRKTLLRSLISAERISPYSDPSTPTDAFPFPRALEKD